MTWTASQHNDAVCPRPSVGHLCQEGICQVPHVLTFEIYIDAILVVVMVAKSFES